MEENNNADVPIEQVNQVIANNGNQVQPAPVAQPVQQPAPVEAAPVAPIAQQAPVVEVIPQEAAPQQPANVEGQAGSLPLTQQPAPAVEAPAEVPEIAAPVEAAPVEQPATQPVAQDQPPARMKFLQFECKGCEFKTYVNLEDDKLMELPDKLKCMNCQKKKSIKRRIMDMTWHGVADYVAPTESVGQPAQ